MSPLKLIEGGGSYLELKVSNSIEDEMTKMSWWIRHGIVEEYKKYGIVEGESTLYVQDVSLNKLNKLKFGLKSAVNVKSLITQLVTNSWCSQ